MWDDLPKGTDGVYQLHSDFTTTCARIYFRPLLRAALLTPKRRVLPLLSLRPLEDHSLPRR